MDKHPTCECDSKCDSKLSWKGWKKGFTSKYARGHNARIDSVYLNPEKQKAMAQKRMEGYASGRNKIWSEGLNKETDSRIAEAARKTSKTLNDKYSSGELHDWRIDDPEKALHAIEKSNATKQERFSNGDLKPWNLGLKKETDRRMLKISNSIKEKLKSTSLTTKRALSTTALEKLLKEYASPNDITLVTPLSEYRNKYQKLEFKCNKCEDVMLKNIMMLRSCPRCFCCEPKGSQAQIEIARYVKTLGFDISTNDRTVISPKELDIFVPEKRLAIEFNGLYWHSDAIHPNAKDHFQQKSDACEQANVSLFNVFEDEWRDKRPIVEDMIRHRLGASNKTIGARKLSLRVVEQAEANKFFDKNHLDGHVRAQVTFGLYKDEELLAALSLRRAFHKSYESFLEVARSCCLIGVSIPGWLGRLSNTSLEYAMKSGKKGIITYVDGRIGNGSSYQRSGWSLLKKSTGQRFWWTDFISRYNRFQIRADSKNGITEKMAAKDACVSRIYACSNSLWVIHC